MPFTVHVSQYEGNLTFTQGYDIGKIAADPHFLAGFDFLTGQNLWLKDLGGGPHGKTSNGAATAIPGVVRAWSLFCASPTPKEVTPRPGGPGQPAAMVADAIGFPRPPDFRRVVS